MAKISVIVPVYNAEKFLDKCLNSIINQTFKDLEIICVNDGSTDRSPEILNHFAGKDKRIKIITQLNSGLSRSRNKGLAIASGKYAGFIDADDWVDLDFFEKLYNTAEKYNADIAVCGIKRLRTYKWKYHLKIEKEEYTTDTNKKFVLCDVPDKCYVWNKIYRLQALREYNIDFEPDVYFEDRQFTAQALVCMKSLVTVPNVYYNYWTNPHSIVKTKSEKKTKDSKYTKEKMMHFLKEKNVNLDHYFTDVKKFKLFGLTLVKTKYYKHKKEFILLNQIKFAINN